MIRIVYDPDPRAGAVLARDDRGRWLWEAASLLPRPGDQYLAVLGDGGRVSGTWDARRRQFYSNGTVVRGQRRGVATALWRHLIATFAPIRVVMDVVTDAGWAMAASLRRQHPDVRWSVSDMR